MKRVLFTALGLAPAITGGGLVPGDPGGPVLTTPGTATWTTETTDSGIRAIYSITGDTVLDWGQLDVPFGDELVFDFVDGSAGNNVANMLGGGTVHSIDGSVWSDGNVGFFAGGSDLVVNGSVTAASVILTTLSVDAADLLDGDDTTLTGSGLNFLSIDGDVTATSGDLTLAGGFIDIDDSASLNAAGRLGIAGFNQQVVMKDNGKIRSDESTGMGFVLSLGTSSASRIEIVAGTEIANAGRLQTHNGGNGQIYLEVGPGGQITNEGSGLIVGAAEIVGNYDDDGTTFGPDEGDAATAVNSSALKIPALRRPDGSRVSRGQVIRKDATMAASADAGRDRNRGSLAVANRGSLMKRASFFGMRGGKGADKAKKPAR
jgi:hypothetical protein